MSGKLLAIDPGTNFSGYVTVEIETYRPIVFDKIYNEALSTLIYKKFLAEEKINKAVIEMPQFFGANMTAGGTVFETCVWVGRYMEALQPFAKRMYRAAIKNIVTGTPRSTDAQVRRVLIDRFAKHDFKQGKGTKANPDWFYGFRLDIWQAYAAAVAYIDDMKEGGSSVF